MFVIEILGTFAFSKSNGIFESKQYDYEAFETRLVDKSCCYHVLSDVGQFEPDSTGSQLSLPKSETS